MIAETVCLMLSTRDMERSSGYDADQKPGYGQDGDGARSIRTKSAFPAARIGRLSRPTSKS